MRSAFMALLLSLLLLLLGGSVRSDSVFTTMAGTSSLTLDTVYYEIGNVCAQETQQGMPSYWTTKTPDDNCVANINAVEYVVHDNPDVSCNITYANAEWWSRLTGGVDISAVHFVGYENGGLCLSSALRYSGGELPVYSNQTCPTCVESVSSSLDAFWAVGTSEVNVDVFEGALSDSACYSNVLGEYDNSATLQSGAGQDCASPPTIFQFEVHHGHVACNVTLTPGGRVSSFRVGAINGAPCVNLVVVGVSTPVVPDNECAPCVDS